MPTQTASQIAAALASARKATDHKPSPAQIESGNYAKGKVTIHGLAISIENPKGSTRSGTDRKGKKWSVTMKSDYGYIRRAGGEVVGKGKDGDHVDVFIGEHPESELVFVINQVNPDTGRFDEHKCVLGATSEQEARETYLANYSPGWKGLGEIRAMPVAQFRQWLTEGNLKKPAEPLSFSASDTMNKPIPQEVQAILDQESAAGKAKGLDDAAAKQFAYRMLNLRGWYIAPGGAWKQLAPDVRNRVNLRFAEPQPDGKFAVFGVDVFYPNAVKAKDGKPVAFDAERIRRIIVNTNRAIAAGAPRPAVTKHHITTVTKAMGVDIPSHGEAINFSESPRGNGWVRCDMVGLPAKLVEEWKSRSVTNLSAAFVGDANSLNERVGHVMIGSESQALSHLPATEVFSVSGQLLFSADEADFHTKSRAVHKENRMPMNKEHCGSLKSAYSALSAAYASAEAGEEGAESKIEEAEKQLTTLQGTLQGAEAGVKKEEGQQMAGEPAVTNPVTPPTEPTASPAGGEKPGDKEFTSAAQNKAIGAKADEMGIHATSKSWKKDGQPIYKEGDHDWPSYSAETFAADPVGCFTALQDQVKQMGEMLNSKLAALEAGNAQANANAARAQFQAFCAEHTDLEFIAADALAEFDDAAGNAKIIERIKGRILKSPKKTASPSEMGRVFGAEAANAEKPEQAGKVDHDLIHAARAIQEGTQMTFSADEIAFAGSVGSVIRKSMK